MKPTAHLLNTDPKTGFFIVFLNGKQYTIYATDANFNNAVQAFKTENWNDLLNILDPTIKINNLYAKYEQIEVKDGNVFVYDEPVHTIVAERILQFLGNGIDCTPVFKFLTKLQMNPSKRAVDELYTFLEHRNLPVTENGNFLAYKGVNSEYRDCHTNKFDNSVGQVLSMPRNRVDDDKEVGCSYGFHAGTLEYASGFKPHNGHMMIVEIDPSDVVSIPLDSDCQKLRTCRYKVVGEYEDTLTKPLYETKFKTENDDFVNSSWDDDDYDEDDVENYEEEEEYYNQPLNDWDYLWSDRQYSVESLIGYLFKNRKPALAMKARREAQGKSSLTWKEISNIVGNDTAYSCWEAEYN